VPICPAGIEWFWRMVRPSGTEAQGARGAGRPINSIYGEGGNGKGVFLNTLAEICGDYAKVAPADMFVDSAGDRHPTDMASLQGARLVTAQEIEDGKSWAEAKIKALTGGDPVTARFMRQNFFTYSPQFKLLIAANHKPRLRNVGEAIRRRLHLIPFTVTIAPETRDLDLMDKLRAEHPGILAWAIEGCLGWLRVGLKRPPAVKDATEEYLAEQDPLRDWIEECIEFKRDGWLSSTALYASYKRCAEDAGEKPISQRAFSLRLLSRGWCDKRDGQGRRGFAGVAWKGTQAWYHL